MHGGAVSWTYAARLELANADTNITVSMSHMTATLVKTPRDRNVRLIEPHDCTQSVICSHTDPTV